MIPTLAIFAQRRRVPDTPLLFAYGFWFVLASIFASQHAVTVWAHGDAIRIAEILKHQLLGLGPWAVLTPAIFAVARRAPPIGMQRWRNIGLHTGAATVCVFVHGTLAVGTAALIMPDLIKEPLVEHYWKYVGESYGFSILLYVAIVFLLYLRMYARVLSERDVERAELRERLAKAQLEALQLQLHPHFLFNTLNTISALIHENPDGADRMIEQLSEFLRSVLENARGEPITLGEELRLLQVYLSIQKTRYRSRLRFDISAGHDVEDCLVPSLLLQPIVENAVKHGLSARGHGTVRITAQIISNCLEIKVADDGGDAAVSDKGMGVGMANTRARLRHFYGDAFDLSLVRRPAGGAVVTIRIPLDGASLPEPVRMSA